MDSEEFNVALFEKKLSSLKDTQDSIQSVSSWCLQNRSHHKKIVSSWLNVLKQVKMEQRLTLFHLANDVIQYSKRKNYEFVESWGTTLQRATTMVRDDKIKHKILRIFQIWEQRGVYNDEFLSDLNGLLSITSSKKQISVQQNSKSSSYAKDTSPTDIDDFQSSYLVTNIRECVKLEVETDKNITILNKTSINDLENIKLTVKDRVQVEEVEHEINDTLKKLEVVIRCLNGEIKARTISITTIEQADAFFDNQRGEVKVVTNAYRNFGNRIKNMKKKLEELQTTLPSPIPSPDINAPSPEPDNDFILPDENDYLNHQLNMSSYIGAKLPFDINDFNSESSQSRYEKDSAQPIQVINSRATPKDESNFNLQDFFKTYLDSYSPVGPISAPPQTNYQNYQSPQIMQNPVTPNYPPPIENISPYIPQNHQNEYNIQHNVLPLLPPPLPPALDHPDAYNPASWDDGLLNWNSSQDSNNFDDLLETPVSPPHFERKGLETDLIEYIDGDNELVPAGEHDIDHRQLNIPNMDGKQMKNIGRGVDIDHRNLISLTGSPVTKCDEPVPPPPQAPPLLWSGTDVDFRQQMQMPPPPISSASEIETDVDYRVPPLHGNFSINNSNNNNANGSDQTQNSSPVMQSPLEPPPIREMNEFLQNTLGDSGLESPTKSAAGGRNKNFNSKQMGLKNQNGRDNVESVDMEMSDEDIEDPFYQQQQPQQHFNNNNNNNQMRSPSINQIRPQILLSPKFNGPSGPQFQKPWQNNMMMSNNNNERECPPPMSPVQNYHGQMHQPRSPFPFPGNRSFSPGMNNFRGNGNNRGSPYFRPQRHMMAGHNNNNNMGPRMEGGMHLPGPQGPGFRPRFRGNMKRGGMW